jgi:hypothetical protein
MSNHQKPEPWHGMTELLQKLAKIGWIGGANIVGRADGLGMAGVDFTPTGIESLKPFADFWNKVGGLNERQALALFFVAIQSQKP